MLRDELIREWQREEQAPFAGWDFSYLSGRMIEEETPWSYETRAAELLGGASAALDLDTGGGERLLALRDSWPPKVAVTEGYPPNIKSATERLSSLGVQIVAVPSEETRLPFADGEFDLILNRHGVIYAMEINRILVLGGTFLTQQVHGLWAHDLLAAFDLEPTNPDETLEKYVSEFAAAGMKIVRAEDWQGTLHFTDVGAIVYYYLKAIPWTVPGFAVATHLKYLLRLQERLEGGDELTFAARKYLLEAQRSS